jgi:cbb3-type cytochrome oxidase maturation protein
MTAIFFLIGASLLVALGFLIAFLWAVRTGQYDDTYTPSVRILFEDELDTEINNDSIILNNQNSHHKPKP